MNQNSEQFRAVFFNKKRREIFKIAIIILVPLLIFIGVMCMAASRYFAHKQIAEVNDTRQVLNPDSVTGIDDGRILVVGIVVLAVLSGLVAPVISGGRYNYTQMVSTILVVGVLNLFIGQGLWKSNSPDPRDCASFSLAFCVVLAVIDLIVLLIIGAFGWAARRDGEQ